MNATDEAVRLAPLNAGSPYVPLRISVHERLRAAILGGTLKPGEVLSENRLATQFGVSRTPIREALRMLEREALVTVQPGRRLVVSIPTIRDIDEIYGIRMIVEVAALRRISSDDAEIIDRLEACTRRDAQALDRGDPEALMEPGADFHMTLIATLGNRRLQLFIDSIHELVTRFRLFSLEDTDWAAQAVEDHAAIVALLRQGRNEEAVNMLTKHLERANEGLKQKFHEAHTEGEAGTK